jgi:hypothetical protein
MRFTVYAIAYLFAVLFALDASDVDLSQVKILSTIVAYTN